MSNHPTATFPTADHLARLEHEEAAHRERLAGPFETWRDAAPTELLPVVGRPAPSRRERTASTASTASTAGTAGTTGTTCPRVSTHPNPTAGRKPLADAPTGTKGLRRRGTLSRHLRAALAGLLIASAILIPMQLFAARGISSARQSALQDRQQTSASAVPMSGQSTHSGQGASSTMSGQSSAQPEWVTEHTGAAYDRTNPAASPLDLPRCTTSPDTPLPCLATISPSQTRAVVLEEDASLTALVHQ